MVASRRIRLMASIMAFLFLLSCGTRSVSRDDLTIEQLRDLAVVSLVPGDVIRYARTGSNQRVEAVVQEIEHDGVYVCCGDDGITFLETVGIEWLWVRRRSLQKGALIGAIPGFVVVTGLSAIGLGSFDGESILLAPLLGCIGALITGGTGAVVGAVIPRWEPLF